MDFKEYIQKTRQLETTHPQPEEKPWNEVRAFYRDLCKKWFDELTSDDKKQLKALNPPFQPWGLEI